MNSTDSETYISACMHKSNISLGLETVLFESYVPARDAAVTFRHVATHSHCVLVESLNKDEFNNDAVGGVRTNHSFFSLWVSLAGLAPLSFLLVYFPCS